MVKTLTKTVRGEKTRIIKEYIGQYPNLTIRELTDRINDEQHLDVKNGHVYAVRERMLGAADTPAPAMSRKRKVKEFTCSGSQLLLAKDFVFAIGGVEAALTAVKEYAAFMG